MKLLPFETLGAVSYSPSIVTVAVSVAICDIFSVKEWRDLEHQGRGRSRSLKMAQFDRPYATYYWSAIVNIALSCTIFEFFTFNNIVTLKSGLESLRSLEMAPLESFGMVSYLHFVATIMAVSLAVCEILSVKEWRDLENLVRGCSRSLKMAPFDRPYTTFYWSAIVSIVYHFRVI